MGALRENDLPFGVSVGRKYDLSFGRGVILGVTHNEANPTEVINYLENELYMSIDAFCVEAPNGLQNVSDHNIAKQYKSQNNCKIICIDRKPAEYEGGNEYIDEKQKDGYSKDVLGATTDATDGSIPEEIGETEKNSPEWGEVNREREQMMALEIIDAHEKGYRTIVVICGFAHAKEIESSLRTMQNKYNY